MPEEKTTKYLLAVDAPDPDNLVLLRMAQTLFGEKNILGALLTGRPIKFDATKDTSIEDWNYDHSRTALKASATRLKNFLKGYNSSIDVYDGGIAPRTLVPHWIHFLDYYQFLDIDPLRAVCISELDPIENLASKLEGEHFNVLVGGPMTGLTTLLKRFPSIKDQIVSVHAMYGSLGNVKLMEMSDKPRETKQFNVACDPFSGKYVVDALHCPIYFVTSECTRNDDIGFPTPTKLREHLEDTSGNRNLIKLYEIWFSNAIEPRKENIYLHDVCAAISASKYGKQVYNFAPMAITNFPHLPKEKEKWGMIEFKEDPKSNIHVATSLKDAGLYLRLLKEKVK